MLAWHVSPRSLAPVCLCHPVAVLCCLQCAVGGEPVWRQVLRLHLNHSDPEVAQQAAAALAE